MDSISKSGPSAGGTTNMMHIFQSCNDISDAVELFAPQQLYLKPVARLNVSVQLPQLKQPGKTISNWEVMERLKNMVKPTEFIVLKVSKSTLEFIRFEGEIESKSNLEGVVSRLDGRTIKLSGFSDLLKVRAAEAKVSFPTRHSWDSYFRDAKNMNEMKPGERPDTIHITNLPCKWFSSKHDLAHGSDLPSEYIFRKVFEQFGEVRCVDIPLLDPYRNLMKAQISGMKTFSFGQGLAFEGYVQFQEYVCFVKAMDALRGMKLLHKEGDKSFTASIKVDFDKTKHLSEASIRRRKQEREHLMASEREVEERERRAKEAEEREAEALRNKERQKQQMKEDRRRQREERRKAKHLKRIKEEEARVMNRKIAIEERKLIIAQRKLESIRLLDELFERVKMELQKEQCSVPKPEDAPKKDSKATEGQGESNKEDLSLKERELRQRLLKKYQSIQEKLLEEQREKLRRTLQGRSRLESVATKPADKDDSGSDSSRDKRSPSRRLDKSKKRNDDPSTERRYDWYPGMPVSDLSAMDLTAYVHAYGFQPRFPYRGFYRQSGRWQRYPRGRNVQPFYYGQWNEEYYKYFRKVAERSCSRSISRSKTRSKSRSRSKSKHKSRSKSKHRSRSKSKHRSRSKSKHRSRSKSRHRSRSKSRHRSRSKSRHRSRSKSRHRSRSKSRHGSRTRSRSKSRSKSLRCRPKFDRSRSSPERSRSRTRNRSNSRRRDRSRSHSRNGSRGRRRRKSRSHSFDNRRRSKSGSRSGRRKSNSSKDRRTSKPNQSRTPSPQKRTSRRSTSPRSKLRNRSADRANSKRSLRSLSRELSLSLSPDVGKRSSKNESDKRSISADRDKKESKKTKDSKKEKRKAK